jgi:putative Holliday junction resolvase
MRSGVRLGVDFGRARVGLAVSDGAAAVVLPLRSVAAESAVAQIQVEVAERECVEVVVGLPLTLAGTEGPAAAQARVFAADLAAAVPVPVRLVDERLTTAAAARSLRSAGVRGTSGRTRSRQVIDAAAAAEILTSALDTERSTGKPAGELVAAGGAP